MAHVSEIAPDVFEISVLDPTIAFPAGFSFNQFLIRADEPLLYHTGMRRIFPEVFEAVTSLIDIQALRWITFAHVEDDECGALGDFLAAVPSAQVVHGALGRSTIADLCGVTPRVLEDGDAIDLGGKTVRRRVRHIETPHVPHNWESRVIFEETTGTLFCGDLGTQVARDPIADVDQLVTRAVDAETQFRYTSNRTLAAATMRSLAELEPQTLAIMHGASFSGDGREAMLRLADAYDTEHPEHHGRVGPTP